MFVKLGVFFLVPLVLAKIKQPAARRILGMMNRNADPCEDFYEYACGKYIEDAVIPDSETIKSFSTDLRDITAKKVAAVLRKPIRRRDIEPIRKAKKFFHACCNTRQVERDSINSALEYLNANGGTWPTFDPSWDETDFDLEVTLAAAQRIDSFDMTGFALGPFIRMHVLRDPEELDFRITFKRPGFLVSDALLNDPDIQDELEDLIIDTLILLGADTQTAEADGQALLEFERQLQMLPFGDMMRLSLDNLQAALDYFEWIEFLNEVFRDTATEVDGSEVVIVNNWDYYVALENLLDSTPARAIANHIKWRTLALFEPAMAQAIRERFFRLPMILTGVQKLQSRVEHCAFVVSGHRRTGPAARSTIYGMANVVGRMVVQRFFRKAEQRENEKMGEIIKEVIIRAIEQNDWLSAETKALLLLKLRRTVLEYIAPSIIFDDQYLAEFYRDDLDISLAGASSEPSYLALCQHLKSSDQVSRLSGHSSLQFDIRKKRFLENYISSLEGVARRTFEQLGEPERRGWIIAPTGLYRQTRQNTLVVAIPAAIIQDLNFNLKFPKVVNFAGSGLILAHQLGHSVATRARPFDEMGIRVGDSLSVESAPEFEDRLNCLIDQYSQFDIPLTGGIKVNGVNTLEENLADNFGLKFALQAYEKLLEMKGEEKIPKLPFTSRQLFFIRAAQQFCGKVRPELAKLGAASTTFSPGNVRATVPLQNSPEFAEAFSCPVGSFMNPQEKCILY